MTVPPKGSQLPNAKNVPRYVFGCGSRSSLPALVEARRSGNGGAAIFLIDRFFTDRPGFPESLGAKKSDAIRFIDIAEEPTTKAVDALLDDLRTAGIKEPAVIVGVGGGTTLDTAKAVANLFTNPGHAADYQGWDLVRNPGIYKIGVPTISGTGAESSRTCVMTNHATGLKLGMNSDYTIYDQLVLDPDLSATVQRDQYFFTGMDSYIHCVESLAGRYRNPIGDAYSGTVLNLCRQVFLHDDMMSRAGREKLMVASYLGGCALATSFVGLVHPLSAGLSVVLGLHHGVANCITLRALDEFYPDACAEFQSMIRAQAVSIPRGVCDGLPDEQLEQMCESASLHEKPLTNALGPDYEKILTKKRMLELYRRM
jgi:3-deoxy-alpha-D-manno-octulosonate 8-oxidase